MASLLLAGTILRAKVPLLRQGLVPASLIAGVLGFVLIAAGWSFGLEAADFVVFTFHFFTLSFMSLCLTGSNRSTEGQPSIFKGGTWMGLIWMMNLVMQALVGLLVIVAYNHWVDNELSEFLGLLVTHGFTQGPGQALVNGTIWQDSFNIENAATVGLIYASFGFIAAFCIGVPIARWVISKRADTTQDNCLDDELLSGYYKPSTTLETGRHITHAANIDTLSLHIAILALAYLLTNALLSAVQPLVAGVQPYGIRVDVMFSHNVFFIWGLVVCMIIRAVMDKLGIGHFIDNETQKRITSSSVDFMVVATIMSIKISILVAYLWPILLVSVAVIMVTVAICFGFAKLLDNYQDERALTSFGCCCGSTGSGLLLLRIVDPNFQSPIAKELAFFNVAIVFLTFHITFGIGPVLPNFGLLTILIVYIATFELGLLGLWLLSKVSVRSTLKATQGHSNGM